MKFEYKIKGVTLDEHDMICIKNYYEQRCTAEYLVENYGLDEEQAMRLAFDVRELMDDFGCDEDMAIETVFQKEGVAIDIDEEEEEE